MLLHIVEAVALGLGIAAILWLFGRFAVVRRVRLSVLFAALAFGLHLILKGSGIAGEARTLQLLTAAVVMLGANAAIQLLDLLLWDYWLGRRQHVPVPRLLVDLFNFVALTAVGLAVLSEVFEVELSALLVTSTVVSAVIGLSLQDILGNLIAGLALQLERPFSVGDWVEIDGQMGQLVQMNWRTLILRTRDHHHVILPNASAAKQKLVNYSRPTPLQMVHAGLGLSYGHSPAVVKETIVRAAASAEGVCVEPGPEVLLKDYGDYAIHYDVRYWITDYARLPQIHDAVMTRIWYELRRAGLAIPFPIQDVTVRTMTEDEGKRTEAHRRHEIFAGLRPLPLLAPLSDDQVESVGRGAALLQYAPGEALVRQGEAGDSLFVIRSGQMRVDVKSDGGQVTTVATLGPGDFFGEMSLLTGEPRSASVVALTEAQVIEVEKANLNEVISGDSGVLDALTTALEARLRNSAERVAAGTGPLARKQPVQHSTLLGRIQAFFGIRAG